MLRIRGRTAKPAANANAGVDLKPIAAIRIDQFDRRLPFPVVPLPAGIRIDALRAEQVVEIHYDRQRRDRLQVVFDRINIGVDDRLVHPIVDLIGAPAGRPTFGRLSRRRLADHVVQEEIRLRIDIAGLEIVFERHGAQHGRGGDVNRARVYRSGRGRGNRTIRGVANHCVGRFGRDRHIERGVEESAIDAEFRVGDETGGRRCVVSGVRRRNLKVAELILHLARQCGVNLRPHQEIAAANAKVQTMNRQYVLSRDQCATERGNVEGFKLHGQVVRMQVHSRVVPLRRFRCVRTGDLLAVDVGDKPVVVAHPQQQSADRFGIVDLKPDPHIGRAVDMLHRQQVGVDIRNVRRLRVVAPGGRSRLPAGIVEVQRRPGRSQGRSAHGVGDERKARRARCQQRHEFDALLDAVRDILLLRRVSGREIRLHRRAIGSDEREIFAIQRQAKIRMQLRRGIDAILSRSEDDQKCARIELNRRKRPEIGGARVVRKMVSCQIHRRSGRIEDLDPIGILAVGIDQSIGVIGHELRNDRPHGQDPPLFQRLQMQGTIALPPTDLSAPLHRPLPMHEMPNALARRPLPAPESLD